MVMLRNFSSTEFKVQSNTVLVSHMVWAANPSVLRHCACVYRTHVCCHVYIHIIHVASVLTTFFGFISFSINVLIKDAKLELVWKCTPVNNNVLINGINITTNHHSLASTSSLSHFIQRSEHAHYTYPYTINRIYRKINTKYIQHSTAVCITFFCALLLLTYCIIQHSFLTMHKKCSILGKDITVKLQQQ